MTNPTPPNQRHHGASASPPSMPTPPTEASLSAEHHRIVIPLSGENICRDCAQSWPCQTALMARVSALTEAEKRNEWREGIVNVLDHEGNYLGCMGADTWKGLHDGPSVVLHPDRYSDFWDARIYPEGEILIGDKAELLAELYERETKIDPVELLIAIQSRRCEWHRAENNQEDYLQDAPCPGRILQTDSIVCLAARSMLIAVVVGGRPLGSEGLRERRAALRGDRRGRMTADLSTLTDDALNLRLAEHCGWRKLDNGDWLEERNGGGRRHYQDPKFTASVDALLAPGGPIERCRERGWYGDLRLPGESTPYSVSLWAWDAEKDGYVAAKASTAARALAEAACAALEATE